MENNEQEPQAEDVDEPEAAVLPAREAMPLITADTSIADEEDTTGST